MDEKILGQAMQVRFDRDPESGWIYSRVAVDLRGRSPGMLKIAPPGAASRIARMFGNQDIVIGDDAFDDHFIIMANPESLAHRVFAPERRARMIAAVRRMGNWQAPFIDLTAEKLSVGVLADVEDRRGRENLLATARDFVEVLLEIGPVTEIVWLDSSRVSGGQCQVCGTEMRERIVFCAKCRTPHHEECWRYAGECSTYACKETSYVKDGQVVRMPDRRQTPEEWLQDEMARDRRETGGGLRAAIRAFPEAEKSLRRFERRQRERRR